jgi:uroporphyrin-3 C-methyltransferase
MMSENAPPSNPAVMPTNASTNTPSSSPRISPWFILALVALVLLGWQWLETRHKLTQVEQEVAKRLADFDTASKEEHGVQKELRQQAETLQAKLGAFEGKLGEFQAQGLALQNLLQDAARSREEVALLEVEQAVTLASQQLQLSANVPVALLALQAADARLARLDRPAYLPLRKALAKDIQQLSALPVADVPGISLRLEQVVIAVDKLPLAAYGRPPEKTENAQPAAALPVWQQQGLLVWNELKSLIRIQRFDHEEMALLAPNQGAFLRENIKLRLLNARLALLSRDQATFRSELKAAQEALSKYFVADDKAVRAAVTSLQQMVSAPVSLEVPSLNDTLAVLRTARSAKDKR